jgi:hypothetical protein
MALLFCDSFDHYDTAHILEKYVAAPNAVITTPGRNIASSPNNCLEIPQNFGSSWVNRAIPSSTTLIVGIAINPGSVNYGQILAFVDNLAVQCAVLTSPSGQILVQDTNGNTLAATANGLISSNVYSYVEVQIDVDPLPWTLSAWRRKIHSWDGKIDLGRTPRSSGLISSTWPGRAVPSMT